SLAIAVANAGGLGGCGALMMQPEAIRQWAADVRAGTNGGFQFNLWIPAMSASASAKARPSACWARTAPAKARRCAQFRD
ncbi:MAG TPA: hypothetical protein VF866_00825, partial [Xanthobacteraceae bacterium]